MVKDKSKRKEYLDKRTSDCLQSECDRLANTYIGYKFPKQAKKVRAFKKCVREMVGSL